MKAASQPTILRNHILPISVFVAAAASGSTPISSTSIPLRTNINPIWRIEEQIIAPPSSSIRGSVSCENGPFTASLIRALKSPRLVTSSMNRCAMPSPIQTSIDTSATPNRVATSSFTRLLTTSRSASMGEGHLHPGDDRRDGGRREGQVHHLALHERHAVRRGERHVVLHDRDCRHPDPDGADRADDELDGLGHQELERVLEGVPDAVEDPVHETLEDLRDAAVEQAQDAAERDHHAPRKATYPLRETSASGSGPSSPSDRSWIFQSPSRQTMVTATPPTLSSSTCMATLSTTRCGVKSMIL